MNDEELITLLRDQRDKLPLTIPVEEIIKRGRMQARHQRNRLVTMVTLVTLVLGSTGAFVSSRIGTPPSRPSPNAVRGHVSQPRTASGWRLVADINPDWKAVQAAGFEAGFSLTCPSTSTCYAENLPVSGMQAEVEVTNDGGNSWKQSELPVTLSGPTRLACVDADTCAILGNDGAGNATFLETTDGGQSWTASPGPSDLTSWMGLTELSCTVAASCVALSSDPSGASGAAEAYTTDDGGGKWSESPLPPDFVPGALQCVSASTCVATGFFQSPDGSPTAPAGTVLYSTDSGVTWATASLPTQSLTTLGALTRLSCANASDCIAKLLWQGRRRGGECARLERRRRIVERARGLRTRGRLHLRRLLPHRLAVLGLCTRPTRQAGTPGPSSHASGRSPPPPMSETWQNAQLPAGFVPSADIPVPPRRAATRLGSGRLRAAGNRNASTSVLLASRS